LESMLEALEKLILRRRWLIAGTRKFEEKVLSSKEFYEKWSRGL